jgi:hypothetical protein
LIVDTPDHIDQPKIPAKAMTLFSSTYRRRLAIHKAPPTDQRTKGQREAFRRFQSSHPAPAMRSNA